jgi:hypothetical protein
VKPNWLTPPAIVAAQNINKELTRWGEFAPVRASYNDFFGKRQIDGKSRNFKDLTVH